MSLACRRHFVVRLTELRQLVFSGQMVAPQPFLPLGIPQLCVFIFFLGCSGSVSLTIKPSSLDVDYRILSGGNVAVICKSKHLFFHLLRI